MARTVVAVYAIERPKLTSVTLLLGESLDFEDLLFPEAITHPDPRNDLPLVVGRDVFDRVRQRHVPVNPGDLPE